MSKRCIGVKLARTIVVIPAMNEEKHIGKVVADVKKYVRTVIVVDDGSTDRTAEFAKEAGAKTLVLPKNMGKGAALRLGVIEALNKNVNNVIMMDGDGQHRAEDLPLFLEKLEQGYDAAYGQRMGRGKMPLIKRIGNKIIVIIFRILFGFWPGDLLCGFKAFTADALKMVLWKSNGYSVEPEIMAKSPFSAIIRRKSRFCSTAFYTKFIEKIASSYIFQFVSFWICSFPFLTTWMST